MAIRKFRWSTDGGLTWNYEEEDLPYLLNVSALDTVLVEPIGATSTVPADDSVLDYPSMAIFGPSTARQNHYGAANRRFGSLASGPVSWANALRRMFHDEIYFDGTDTLNYSDGANFAEDGVVMSDITLQVDAAIAAGYNGVSWLETGRNNFDGNMSAADYMTNALAIINKARPEFQIVFLPILWLPNTGLAGWESGSVYRTRLLEVADWQRNTNFGANVIKVDLPSVLTDPSSPDGNPYADAVRDTRHLSSKGGRRAAAALIAAAAPLVALQPYPTSPGNLLPAMSGTGGTFGNGASGTTFSGYRLEKGNVADPAAVVGSIYNDGSKLWARTVITAQATPTPTTGDFAQVKPITSPNPGAGKTGAFYVFRMRVKVHASNIPYVLYAALLDNNVTTGQRGTALVATDASGSPQSADGSSSFQWFDGTKTEELWVQTDPIVYQGTTSMAPFLNIIYGQAANGETLQVDVTDMILEEVTDQRPSP